MFYSDFVPVVTTRRGLKSPSNSKSRINPTKKAFSPFKLAAAKSPWNLFPDGLKAQVQYLSLIKLAIANQKSATILSLKGAMAKYG